MASSSKRKRISPVFFSFGGMDLRHNFVSRLKNALDQNGIYTSPEHMLPAPAEVIEESPIAIIIFSENFASSPCCWEDVAKIMECRERGDLRVIPVFYKVDPGEVGAPRHRYKEAMDSHESNFGKDSKEVKRWKKALSDAASLSDWHIHDGNESEFTQRIVEEISTYLNRTSLHVAKRPVGIDSQVVKLKYPHPEAALAETGRPLFMGISAWEKLVDIAKAALEMIDVGKGREITKADLEAALAETGGPFYKDLIEGISAWEKFGNIAKAALKKIGVQKGRENTKAALEAALAETGGPFYTDLFKGFQKLEVFISDIWKLSRRLFRRIVEEDVTQNLVGIDRDVPKMIQKLGFYYQNGVVKARVITGHGVLVVWGMLQVGKTTLPKVVFHKIKHLF